MYIHTKHSSIHSSKNFSVHATCKLACELTGTRSAQPYSLATWKCTFVHKVANNLDTLSAWTLQVYKCTRSACTSVELLGHLKCIDSTHEVHWPFYRPYPPTEHLHVHKISAHVMETLGNALVCYFDLTAPSAQDCLIELVQWLDLLLSKVHAHPLLGPWTCCAQIHVYIISWLCWAFVRVSTPNFCNLTNLVFSLTGHNIHTTTLE